MKRHIIKSGILLTALLGCDQSVQSITPKDEKLIAPAARPLPGTYDIEINALTGPNSGTGVNGPGISIELWGKYNPSDDPHYIQTINLEGNVSGAYRQIIMSQAISEITSIVVTNKNVAKQLIYPFNPYPFGWANTDKDWNAQSILISLTDYNLNQRTWSFNINKRLESRESCRNWTRVGGSCYRYNPIVYGTASAVAVPYSF